MSERDITAHMNGQDIGPSKRLIVRIENERGDTVPIASGTIRDLRDQWRLEGIRLGLEAAAKIADDMMPQKPHNTEHGFAASRSSGYRAALEAVAERILAINPTDVLKGGE